MEVLTMTIERDINPYKHALVTITKQKGDLQEVKDIAAKPR